MDRAGVCSELVLEREPVRITVVQLREFELGNSPPERPLEWLFSAELEEDDLDEEEPLAEYPPDRLAPEDADDCEPPELLPE